jgi:hypothetical protein
MRPVVLWLALAAWLMATAAIMWFFNPISAVDLAEVCATAPKPDTRASAIRQ